MKRLENVKVDIELKSLVSRIKGYASSIREKVKKTKEISESFIVGGGDLDDEECFSECNNTKNDHGLQPMILVSKNFPTEIDNSILQHTSQRRPKSGNMASRRQIANFFSTQNNENPLITNEEAVASPRQQEPSMIAPNDDQNDILSRCEESMLNFN